MKFRKKPVEVEAITFNELVEYGKANGGNIVNGMPWSFKYKGYPISHENDDCYLIPTLEGMMKFNRGDMLITGMKGEIYPCKSDIFALTYEPVSQPEGRDVAVDAIAMIIQEACIDEEDWHGIATRLLEIFDIRRRDGR